MQLLDGEYQVLVVTPDDGAKFERFFHTTHFFVTNFFVISRCKGTILFLFGKTIFRGKSIERFSQCRRDASKLLRIWRCNSSLDGNLVISILVRCYEKSHLPDVIYRSLLNIICRSCFITACQFLFVVEVLRCSRYAAESLPTTFH